MSIVNEFIERVKCNSEVKAIDFNEKFLNMIGDMCSIYGYGTVRLSLYGKNDREAKALLKVLRLIEEEDFPTEIGKLLLKNLNTLKKL